MWCFLYRKYKMKSDVEKGQIEIQWDCLLCFIQIKDDYRFKDILTKTIYMFSTWGFMSFQIIILYLFSVLFYEIMYFIIPYSELQIIEWCDALFLIWFHTSLVDFIYSGFSKDIDLFMMW